MLSHKDIELLEKKYKRYKNRKRLKSFLIFIVTISIIGVLSYPLLPKKKNSHESLEQKVVTTKAKDENITKKALKKEPIVTKVAEAIEKKPKEKSKEKIEETSKQEPKKEQKVEVSTTIETNSTTIVTLKENSTFLEAIEEQIEKNNLKKQLKKNKNIKISSKHVDTIQYHLKKYQKLKNYDNAISLAKAYLKNKFYQNSIKYALEANNMDTSKQDSWIIFAKAKYYLGDKRKAIKALESYLGQYRSKDALKLLKQIKSGELR